MGLEIPNIIPWVSPIPRNFQTDIRKEESLRLFALIVQKEQLGGLPIDSLAQRWHLASPFEYHWKNNSDSLFDDIEIEIERDEKYTFQDKRMPLWREELTEIFSDRRFYDFMYISRRLLKDRVTQDASQPVMNFSQRREEILGYPPLVIQEMEDRYKQLVQMFLPPVLDKAKRKSRNPGMPREDWESIASDRMVVAAYYFYWDSAALDMDWTIKRFLFSALASIRDSEKNMYERIMEVHPSDQFFENRSELDTAQAAEEEVDRGRIAQMISKLKSIKDQQIIATMVQVGITNTREIAERLNLPVSEVKAAIERFRETISGKPQREQKPLSRARPKSKWDVLIQCPEKYREIFERNRDLLNPKEQTYIEVILKSLEIDRETTMANAIALYEQRFGIRLKSSTFKDHFYAGMKKIADEELTADLKNLRKKRIKLPKNPFRIFTTPWTRFQQEPEKFKRAFEVQGKKLLRPFHYAIAELVIKAGVTDRDQAIAIVQAAKPGIKRNTIIRHLRKTAGILERTVIEKVKSYQATRSGRYQEALLINHIRNHNPTIWGMIPEKVRQVWDVCYKDPENLVYGKTAADQLKIDASIVSRRLTLGRMLLTKYLDEETNVENFRIF